MPPEGMTTMKTRALRAALATAILALGAASVQAQTPSPVGNTREIRVINNHTSAVRVYAQDAYGRTRSLGWVSRSHTRTLTVPESMAKLGAVRIKVFADEPVWSPRAVDEGVATRPLNLRPGDVANFWIETELTDSHLQILRM